MFRIRAVSRSSRDSSYNFHIRLTSQCYVGSVPLSVSQQRTAFLRALHSSPSLSHPSLTIRHFSPKTKRIKQLRANVAPPECPPPRNIAVVGGGLAGLAVIYHLFNSTSRFARKRNIPHDSFNVTLFDPFPPGKAPTSSAATGLLHSFRPRPKNKMWNHQKAMDAALHLLSIAETVSPHLVSTPGIMKLALDDRSFEDFKIAAHRFPNEVELLQSVQLSTRFPHVSADVPGLYIRPAHVVRTEPYMQALWKLSSATGRLKWSQCTVSSVSELFDSGFDNVILCPGASAKQMTDIHNVPIIPCLGHNLVMQSQSPPPSIPLLSGVYVVPIAHETGSSGQNLSSELHTAIVGATFQYNFPVPPPPPDVTGIKDKFSDKILRMHPSLFDNWSVSSTRTGIRAIPPRTKEGAIPIACKVEGTPDGRSCWLFTGLGGRGLLYHAFLGRCLARSVIAGVDKHIPGDARKLPINYSQTSSCVPATDESEFVTS